MPRRVTVRLYARRGTVREGAMRPSVGMRQRLTLDSLLASMTVGGNRAPAFLGLLDGDAERGWRQVVSGG